MKSIRLAFALAVAPALRTVDFLKRDRIYQTW
jgi:hypothetical protein